MKTKNSKSNAETENELMSKDELLNFEQGDKIEQDSQQIRKSIEEDNTLVHDEQSLLGSYHGHNYYGTLVVVDRNNKVLFAGRIKYYEIEVAGFCHDEGYAELTKQRVRRYLTGNDQAFINITSNGLVANGDAWEIEVEDRYEDLTYKVQIKPKEE